MGATGMAKPGVYELGGPDVDTFRGLMRRMLTAIKRRRLVLGLPFIAGSVMGAVLDTVQAVTLGLFSNGLVTRDQVRNLKRDNVVSASAAGFDALGITPTALDAVLPEYLWRYRPSGQYAAIKDSAKNLRKA
jgi:NADH dehydrogenase